MELTLDVFRNDAFSMARLQQVLPTMPYTPGVLTQMNLFTPHPIDTTIVLLYIENGVVHLIPATKRGDPDVFATRNQGDMRALETIRLSKTDSVRASEMLNVANMAFPLQQRLINAADLVNRRMGQLRTDMAATKELHQLGALQGKLVDADGVTVIVDFFQMMGIAAPVMVDIDFTLPEDVFALQIQTDFYVPTYRVLQTRNGGQGILPAFTLGALAGDELWGKLISHPAVRKRWEAMEIGRSIALAANPLANPPLWESIDFGGVRWIHYMGAVSGPLQIPADQAVFFPIGAKDVFDVYWSPGETLATVGQLGQEEYPILRIDPRQDPEFIDLTLRSYPLYACIFPAALSKARIKP
jgi:hypothetical protein